MNGPKARRQLPARVHIAVWPLSPHGEKYHITESEICHFHSMPCFHHSVKEATTNSLPFITQGRRSRATPAGLPSPVPPAQHHPQNRRSIAGSEPPLLGWPRAHRRETTRTRSERRSAGRPPRQKCVWYRASGPCNVARLAGVKQPSSTQVHDLPELVYRLDPHAPVRTGLRSPVPSAPTRARCAAHPVPWELAATPPAVGCR